MVQWKTYGIPALKKVGGVELPSQLLQGNEAVPSALDDRLIDILLRHRLQVYRGHLDGGAAETGIVGCRCTRRPARGTLDGRARKGGRPVGRLARTLRLANLKRWRDGLEGNCKPGKKDENKVKLHGVMAGQSCEVLRSGRFPGSAASERRSEVPERRKSSHFILLSQRCPRPMAHPSSRGLVRVEAHRLT